MPKTAKMVSDRLDELKALGVTAPEDVDMKALAPLLGMAPVEDLVRERLARLSDMGVVVPEGLEIGKLAPLLGLSPKVGVASEEIISIRAADFLLDHDPSGGNWIKLNKPVAAGGGGRGGRSGGRRRARG
jgi:5-methyltetrahydrofolate--homocysteine methyltransferase